MDKARKVRQLKEALSRFCASLDLEECDGCTACSHKCTTGVPMTHFEFAEIAERLAADPVAREVLHQDQADSACDGWQEQVCPFLDTTTRLCVIYPSRPLVCRLLGHVEWMPCPANKVRRTARTDEALTLLLQYAQLERHPFERWAKIQAQPNEVLTTEEDSSSYD